MTKSLLSKSLGKLITWEKTNHGLSGETSHGKFRVIVYNAFIVRICATREEEFDDFSYAVVATPREHSILDIKDQGEFLLLFTGALVLRIKKDPVRFVFETVHQQVINEDDPAFGISWNGEHVTAYKTLQEGERFIGLGEKTGPLDRKGNGYQNWNTDMFAYSVAADPLYCTTPFYIGVHHHLVYGIFFDNTYKSFFNFGASNNRFSSFAADAGEMNYYFIWGENVPEIIEHYTFLTGRMEMPPLWSIGYQQCRYSYYPDKEVLSLAKIFREKDIPADVIVLDIHYMDQYKIFTWNKNHFTDPQGLVKKLRDVGFNVVVICDPGIKIEEGYDAYEDGVHQDVFIKYPDGTNYAGQVWPGWCHFPDYTSPKAREWWKEKLRDYLALGIKGLWNDMNEIATWGNMLPENIEFEYEGQGASSRRSRNVYGFLMARSSYEGAKEFLKERPFNLTRSGYSGVQRYAAVWTGDNVAYDEHMMLGVRMVSSMGLAGIAFAGYDVGGFVGDANAKLFARWISIGAFSPFFRGHSMINSRDSEPWSYGEEVEQISRNYIKFRYQLLPYIYSLFHQASLTGMPVQRSLAVYFAHDYKVYDHQFQNQYMFGPAILAAPVESFKEFVKVYLPQGEWYYLYNGHKYPGNQEIILECPVHRLPLFVRGSSIVPMYPVKEHTAQTTTELILHVYAGTNDNTFLYYEDDGVSFRYQEGYFLKKLIEYNPGSRHLIIHPTEGDFKTSLETIKLVFHGFEEENSVTINGKSETLQPTLNSFFAALEKYDPVIDPEAAPHEIVKTLQLPYTDQQLFLTW